MPTRYPGSGSHYINTPYQTYLAKYSSAQIYGLPNTTYYFKIVTLPNNVDLGIVKGTIDNWARLYESNNVDGKPCKISDPIGTNCYIGSDFTAFIPVTTDNAGFLSLLFLHCHYPLHDVSLNLEVYEKRGEKYTILNSAYIYSDH